MLTTNIRHAIQQKTDDSLVGYQLLNVDWLNTFDERPLVSSSKLCQFSYAQFSCVAPCTDCTNGTNCKEFSSFQFSSFRSLCTSHKSASAKDDIAGGRKACCTDGGWWWFVERVINHYWHNRRPAGGLRSLRWMEACVTLERPASVTSRHWWSQLATNEHFCSHSCSIRQSSRAGKIVLANVFRF